ncbi:MAG: zinc-ribbon domain-containing protein [Deltaproteobacteria bacterium]|nr:zinc-ribbon domain-containing protein [Deltaproteobacteria bacterium]
MVITCPNCNARFRIDSSGIKLERFKVRCPKCADGIVVENPPEVDVPVSLEAEPPPASAADFPGARPAPSNAATSLDSEPDTSTLGGLGSERPTDAVPEAQDALETDGAQTAALRSSWDDEPRTEDLVASLTQAIEGSGAGPGGETLRIASRKRDGPTGTPKVEAEERTREVKDTIDSVRVELSERFDELMRHNYFELLGVSKEASQDEVKGAYFKLAKKYHPDRYVSQFSDEEMRRLREVSSRLNLAFNELRDPDRHKQYVLKITQPERYEKQQSANRVMEAMMQYEKGKVLFNKQNYGEALKCFEWAVELHTTEAEYHYMVGQACLRGSAGVKPDFERILAALEKAAEIQPSTAKYHLGLGYYWKLRGESKRAMRYFKNVKELDPKNHEAIREIKLYLDRKRKAEERESASGKLKKLFGASKK